MPVLLALCLAASPDPPWNRIPLGDRTVLVTDDGAIGRTVHDPDWRAEYAALRDRAASVADPSVWRGRIFLLRAIDADWVDAGHTTHHSTFSFTDDQIETFRRVAAEFVEYVHAWSGGRVRLDAEISVLDGPLTRLDGEGDVVHPWTGAIDSLIGDIVGDDPLDTVLVFYPAGDIPHSNIWGLTSALAYRGAGYSWVAYLGGDVDERAYAEVALHEWLHQVEGPRSQRLGYSGLPALHDGTKMGYRDGEVFPGWMMYYRDFMTWYMTPAMWRRSARADEASARPRPAFDGGFVREWLVAGPFPNEDDHGLDAAFLDESAAPADGADGWRSVAADADLLDFDARLQPNENVVAYAHVYVHSPDRRAARLWVGSDDGVKVLLNGNEAWMNHTHRPAAPDQDDVLVLLKPGWNRLLFKVDEGVGGWGLLARLSDPDGNAPEGLEFRAARPEADLVEDDDEPLPPEARRAYAWSEVRDDPWRLLPPLRARDVGGRLATGDGYTELAPPASGGVDARLDFASESIARLGDLFLVRADAADYWFERLDAAEPPVAVGRVMEGDRPLVAMRARAAVADAPTELHLSRATDGRAGVNLLTDAAEVALGGAVRCTIRVANVGRGEILVRSARVADRAWEGRRRLPAGQSTTVTLDVGVPRTRESIGLLPLVATVEYSSRGDAASLSDPAVVRVVPPLEVALVDAAGRPVRRFLSGATLDAVAAVRNHTRSPVEAALNPSVPDGWEMTVESAAVTAPAGGEVRIPVRVIAPAAGEAAEPALYADPVREEDHWMQTAWSARVARSPWTFAGPFSNADKSGFAASYPPESAARDARFDALEGDSGWFDWAPAGGTLQTDAVDLNPVFASREWAVAYAALDLESPDERDALLLFGSDDTIQARLNGEPILANDVYRPAAPDQERVAVRLRAGRNRVLVKIGQGGGGWAFYFRWTAPDGSAMPDTTARPIEN